MEGLWGLQGVIGEEYNRDLTNLDLAGQGWEEIVICADGCYINEWVCESEMCECLQFVDDF